MFSPLAVHAHCSTIFSGMLCCCQKVHSHTGTTQHPRNQLSWTRSTGYVQGRSLSLGSGSVVCRWCECAILITLVAITIVHRVAYVYQPMSRCLVTLPKPHNLSAVFAAKHPHHRPPCVHIDTAQSANAVDLHQ
jgi:hypothetical protein